MKRALPLLFLATPAAAGGFQDTAALDRAVAAFAGHAIGEEGGARTAIDARLRLASCPTVTLSWRTEAQDAVVVACPGPSWRIFVPVRRSASVTAAVPATARVQPAAKPEMVIKRGDPVLIEAGASGFSISREGVAMGDAPAGGRFLVRVADARAPVQAVAVEGGRARLPGWN